MCFINKLNQFLEKYGFNNIIIVTDCKEAIKVASNYNDNSNLLYIVIMEYEFATMTGEKLIREIKKRLSANIIVVSGSKKLSDSFSSLRNGAASFIHKDDFLQNPKILIDSINMWLDVGARESIIVKKLEKINNMGVMGEWQIA